MGIYEGGASLIQHALMMVGAIGTPIGLGTTSVRWHVLLWDPGGILFGIAAWEYRRTS